MSIDIFYDDVSYRIRGWRKIKNLVHRVILEEKNIPGDLSFIITSDSSLIEINREFLNHNYYTDVISFRYNSGTIVDGEIYISCQTVKMNAKNYKVSYTEEMIRVIIHGVLHLCGYNDETSDEKLVMRKKEDYWLDEYYNR